VVDLSAGVGVFNPRLGNIADPTPEDPKTVRGSHVNPLLTPVTGFGTVP